MKRVFIAALFGCGLAAATPAHAGEVHLAGLGGLLAGPDTGFLGAVVKLHRESAGHGHGLEAGYGGTSNGRLLKQVLLTAFPPIEGPRVLHTHLATLMVIGKVMAVNPGGGARLFLSGGAGVQDRLIWHGSSGVIGPTHDVNAIVALGFGLEGTTRIAPTAEFRVATLSSGDHTMPAVGMLAGVGFRP